MPGGEIGALLLFTLEPLHEAPVLEPSHAASLMCLVPLVLPWIHWVVSKN
jgi:hypothetical protein